MKNKAIVIMGIILIFISLFYNSCFAENFGYIDNKDRSGIISKTFSEWIETFKSEDIPESKRIISYQESGASISESNHNKIKAIVNFIVEPVSKENTEWNYSEPVEMSFKGTKYKWRKKNQCFIEMTNVNGEYKVDYILNKPKNYDKFMESFEQYKKEHPDFGKEKMAQTEKITIKPNEQNKYKSQEIQKINNNVTIVFSILLVISGGLMVHYAKTHKRQAF